MKNCERLVKISELKYIHKDNNESHNKYVKTKGIGNGVGLRYPIKAKRMRLLNAPYL